MKTFHYGWVIVGVGVLVKMAGLGFGRFTYPMLLPRMRESLHFNYIRFFSVHSSFIVGWVSPLLYFNRFQ